MARALFSLILTLTLMPSLQETAAAQGAHGGQTKEPADPCSRFKMRIVSPDESLDYKMLIVEPPAEIDYKGRVFDPCRIEGTKRVMARPPLPGWGDGLRRPAEILKQSQPLPEGLKMPR